MTPRGHLLPQRPQEPPSPSPSPSPSPGFPAPLPYPVTPAPPPSPESLSPTPYPVTPPLPALHRIPRSHPRHSGHLQPPQNSIPHPAPGNLPGGAKSAVLQRNPPAAAPMRELSHRPPPPLQETTSPPVETQPIHVCGRAEPA